MIKKIARIIDRYKGLPSRINLIQEALGRIEQRQIAQSNSGIADAEFRVFSQWGEDGIIQHLVRQVPIQRRIFVEFGVENYKESNTRFLLLNNYWSGLVIDGSSENIDFIRRDPIYWAREIKAECSFITRENINDILSKNGIAGDIGLLSVDIDGNDYWVWEAINSISPRIVICEYNSHFGPTALVTTPYSAGFVRSEAHSSKIYYGASIAALCSLANAKGYSLVAANMAGNNVFFVRNDIVHSSSVLPIQEAYRRSQFREFHDENGKLTFDVFDSRVRKIQDLLLFDLITGSERRIAEIPGILT